MPFPRHRGVAGKNAQKIHVPGFAHFRNAVLENSAW